MMINSPKGTKLFNQVNELLYSEDSTIEQVTKGNACLLNIAPKGEYSDYFYKKFENMDFIDLIHKIDEKDYYKKLNFKEKVYYILKEKIKLWR